MERRSTSAEESAQEKLWLLRIIESGEVNLEQLERFERYLRGPSRFSDLNLNTGFLGDLLNGNLDAIVQNRTLTRQVMEMSKEVNRSLRIIEDTQRAQKNE